MKRSIKNLLIIVVCLSLLSGISAFAAYDFGGYVGWNYPTEVGRESKKVDTNLAYIRLTSCSKDSGSTNYLLCVPGSGAQMTYAKEISNTDRNQNNATYYSNYYNYNGSVAMTANSCNFGFLSYHISGLWNPNN